MSTARSFGRTAGGALLDEGQQPALLVELFGVRAASNAASIDENSGHLKKNKQCENKGRLSMFAFIKIKRD